VRHPAAFGRLLSRVLKATAKHADDFNDPLRNV